MVLDWREPATVHGTVLDPDGRPFGKVLLHVVYDDGDPTLASETRCEEDRLALDPVTDPEGRFAVRVDPARPYRIVVDPAWEPARVRIEESEPGTGAFRSMKSDSLPQ